MAKNLIVVNKGIVLFVRERFDYYTNLKAIKVKNI